MGWQIMPPLIVATVALGCYLRHQMAVYDAWPPPHLDNDYLYFLELNGKKLLASGRVIHLDQARTSSTPRLLVTEGGTVAPDYRGHGDRANESTLPMYALSYGNAFPMREGQLPLRNSKGIDRINAIYDAYARDVTSSGT